ncbi:DUF7683 domain-containing protein [Treponema saccharophilum]|uniref:DUF7683 domain-containing protein n=1 Tax=Treponema saccharophilum TaxID=165 RepID=UPI0005936A84|nr:hypothetical protein [Treponema saccharophilum]
MIERSITIFDNKTELLVNQIVITHDFSLLREKYNEELNTDPLLIYEYEIKKADVDFYKKFIDIDFEFDKYTYFLSCSEVK